VFVGGGNMATALISGLMGQSYPPSQILVVEPFEDARLKLAANFGVSTLPSASSDLTGADLMIWAIKPQTFQAAAASCLPYLGNTLHLSVAAGVTSDSIAAWLNADRVVRAMPNTPALIGKGITGLFARHAVTSDDQRVVEQVVASTGEYLWMTAETQLDAVTALSGSGPAYMFYFMEAMTEAGVAMGLSASQAQQLAVATFIGAGELAKRSSDPVEVLRERVTSKGGTTYAALMSMEASHIKPLFIQAMQAACNRAAELGVEFGR